LTGREQRLTQGQLLAGQERQIGLTGQEQRKSLETTGAEQRLTQAQLLAGQERQIGLTGQEQRATIGKTGEIQQLINLQQEMFRRYKEERDYAQSRSAYRS
jgi:hypothetical protein